MIRDDNSARQRYGYVRRLDVPVSKNPDANVTTDDKSGLLRVAGDFAIFAVGSVVGGAIIRSSGRSIMRSTAHFAENWGRSESQWLKRVSSTLGQLKSEGDWISGTLKKIEGVAGEGKNAIRWDEVLTDSEKFSAGGLNKDYVKRLAISRAATYARRAPYELPAAYITQRYVIERERTKREIEEGSFNPLNPIDTLGDMATQSAALVAGDLALHMVGPMGRAYDQMLSRTNPAYMRNKAIGKFIGGQATSELLKITDSVGAYTKTAARTIAEIAEEKTVGFSPNAGRARGTDVTLRHRPLMNFASKTRSSVMSVGKTIAGALQDEHRQRALFGNARNANPAVRLGNDLTMFDDMFGKDGRTFSDSLFGNYSRTVQERLQTYGLDAQTSQDLGDLISKRFNRAKIATAVQERASSLNKSPDTSPFRFHGGLTWEQSATELLGRDKVAGLRRGSLTRVDALNKMVGDAMMAPDRITANAWVGNARATTAAYKDALYTEFLRKQGRSRLDLTDLPSGGSRSANMLRDNMAMEAFDTLGVNPWGMAKEAGDGRVWKAWEGALGGVDKLDERTRSLLVSRGKAFDQPFGDYNFLGLKRMSTKTMISVENERARQMRGADTRFGRNAAMFGINPKWAYQGLANLEDRFGSMSTQRMLGERGLYTNMGGDVVDARAMFDAPMRALGFLSANVKLPIIGINPINMFGVGEAMRNRNLNVKYQTPRGNLFERRAFSNLDIDQPMMQVGKKTFASVGGKVQSIGDWTWFSANQASMTTNILRKLSGVPNEFERTAAQKRFVFGGRFLDKAITNAESKGQSIRAGIMKKAKAGIDWMDFEQSADKSLPHQIGRRLQRSGSLRYKAAKLLGATDRSRIVKEKLPKWSRWAFGDTSTATRVNRNFMPHWFEGAVGKISAGGVLDATDKRMLASTRSALASNYDGRTAAMMSEILETSGVGPGIRIKSSQDVAMVHRALVQMEHDVGKLGSESSMAPALSRNVRKLRQLSGDFGIDPMHLDLASGYGQTADASDKVYHQITQGINDFYLTMARVQDPGAFDGIWARVGQMRRDGFISEGDFQKMRSTMAAVEMRVGERSTVEGSWMTNAESAAKVRKAIDYFVGPSSTTTSTSALYRRGKGAKTGVRGVLGGMSGVYDGTLGSKGYFDLDASLATNDPKARNPFLGQRWIGLPSFSSRLGISQGFTELSAIMSGRIVNENADDSNPLGTMAGVLFGQTKGSELTTGTMAGMHLISRVGEATDTIGLGLRGHNYRNPAELMMKGIIGKRAIPAVLGLAAFDVAGGIPLIGKMGVMGGVASAFGPGLGMARAYAGQVTGANWMLNQFSEVTNQEEDAVSRKLGRTPEEEWDYWTQGTNPIRQGRFWVLGNSRFKGGKVNYYKPNWYRTYMSDWRYNDTSAKEGSSGKSLRGSRLEWQMFGNDWSPGRVLSPYHYEKKHYDDRPYPVSGDYFTGPWGPITPLANVTLGAVLKPKKLMHTEDMGGMSGGSPADLLYQKMSSQSGIHMTLQAYESGKLNIGQVVQLGVTGAQMSDAYLKKMNQANARPGRRISVGQLVRRGQMVADAQVNTSASGGSSQAIVGSMNKLSQYPSGTRIAALGGDPSYSTGEGFIPAPFMNIMGKQPYPTRDTQIPQMSQAMKPGLMNYRLGELGYTAQEWGGFYGFMFGSARAMGGGERDFSPKSPVMQSADRMYGMERTFWDQDLGGMGDLPLGFTNIQISEITRRFIPHKRNQIRQVNDIPNMMPSWMPGASDVINYQTGDPYVKQKMGELRMPGAGYEAVNKLHPDSFGSYGAFDRFKILADLAPWSNEYNLYKKLLEKSDLTDDMRKQVTLIKHQVAEKRKKVAVSEYMWSGKLGTVAEGQLGMSPDDPNMLIMEGQDNPIRLAGARFSKSPDGKRQAQAFFDTYLKGKNVKIKADKNGNPVLDNREKTLDAIVIANGENINKLLIDKINDGSVAGSMSQSKNYVDNLVKYSPAWQMLGKVWETVAHAEVPIVSMKIGRQSASEYYERRMVYGKSWQPWETPVKSYLQPMWETYTRDRGLATIPIAAGLTAWAASMFTTGKGNKQVAALIGGTIGGIIGGRNQMMSALRGQRDVPGRRKHEWAVDEYVDILKYVKSSMEYKAYRRAAIEQEGVDPEVIVSVLGESAGKSKDEFQKEWDSAPIGRKPDKPAANKVYENIGPLTAQALTARRRMGATMFGFDMTDDFMTKTAGIPKRFQPLVEGWMNTPKNQQKKLLDILPKPVRRIVEDRWGMPVEKGRDLTEYFKTHELPGPEWEGWMPEVNLDEIQMKIVNHEGLDAAEYGYYPNQMEDALSQPWSYPDIHNKASQSKQEIIDQLSAMGVMDVSITEEPAQGPGEVFINFTHDRTNEVADSLRRAFT